MSVVKSNDKWRQDTPRMQLVSLVMSVQGDISNMANIELSEKQIEKITTRSYAMLEEAQLILKQMPEGEWSAGK